MKRGRTKAMVLAAGLGTRLHPLTEDKPKCLMPLAGRPLMDWTLRWLRDFDVAECVINLHYLPEMVKSFVKDGSQYGLKIHYSYEPTLLGTAGAVKKAAEFFDQPFYVIYSDNFSQWDIRKLKRMYEQQKMMASIAIHWRDDVTQSGMIELSPDSKIINLLEKPKAEDVTSNYVSAGFFYLDPKVLDYIPDESFCDFGFDVIPKMLGAGESIYAVKMKEPLIGIDTKEAYDKANELALSLI